MVINDGMAYSRVERKLFWLHAATCCSFSYCQDPASGQLCSRIFLFKIFFFMTKVWSHLYFVFKIVLTSDNHFDLAIKSGKKGINGDSQTDFRGSTKVKGDD